MRSYTDYIARVQVLMLDKSMQTSVDDAAAALDAAADTLANYRMARLVKEYDGTGLRLYALPDEWDEERSPGGYQIEYPVDDTAGEVQFLDPEMSEIYNAPDGPMLRMRDKDNTTDQLPGTGQKFRLHYSVPFVLADGSVTVPDSLFSAVAKLGARELALILAARFAQQASGLTSGDPADYRDKADKALAVSREFMKDFLRRVAPDPSERAGVFRFGVFEEDPLHRYARTLYPRDNSQRAYTDR